jgi:hypothetical protein
MEDKEFTTFVYCTLPCKHYFCFQCTSSLESSHCPLCRTAFSVGNGINGKCYQMIKQVVDELAAKAVEEKASLDMEFPVIDIEDLLLENLQWAEVAPRRSRRRPNTPAAPTRQRHSNVRRQRPRQPQRESEVDLIIEDQL